MSCKANIAICSLSIDLFLLIDSFVVTLSGRRIQNAIYSDEEDEKESEFNTQELLELVEESRNQ